MTWIASLFLSVVTVATTEPQAAAQDRQPHAGMLRFPDVSAQQVVFVYGNDLWVVAREGGLAQPLASPAGPERFPRFSPDGTKVAFMGNYEGNSDLYVISADGGRANRVTYHSEGEVLCDWTADERLLYFSNGRSPTRRISELFTVKAAGGEPEKLPVPYGANGAIDATGRLLAYTLNTRDARTWKRYRGGMASDVWMVDLVTGSSQRITDWEGTDSLPMWWNRHLYYVSDAGPEHRLNLWRTNTRTGEREQVTFFTADDVHWPSMGPGPDGGGEIVFQIGASLVLFSLSSGELRDVVVRIPGDASAVRSQRVDAGALLANATISPTGKRVVVEARGDLWSLPAEKGAPRNLTHSSGVAERDPAFSPDGRWIAYFSDENGEYELCVRPALGDAEPRTLTSGSDRFLQFPSWSPDSKWLGFLDSEAQLHLCAVESGERRVVDTDPMGVFAGSVSANWSPDSRWIAYSRTGDKGGNSQIYLYDVPSGARHTVTSGMFADSDPVFDRKGEFLYYVATRNFSPTYSTLDTSFVYRDAQRLIALPLRGEWKSPYPLVDDQESASSPDAAKTGTGESPAEGSAAEASGSEKEDGEKKDDEKKEGEKEDGEKKEGDKVAAPVEIDLEGLEARGFLLPPPAGNYGNLAINDKGQLLFTYQAGDQPPSIQLFDPSDPKKEVKEVASGAASFDLSADGKKMLLGGPKLQIQDAAADATATAVPLAGMSVLVDLREEWRQVFRDAWRITRQYFYDPHMHGVNWQAVYDHYAPMIEDCTDREDVEFVIGETIAELNVGHAYVRGAPGFEQGPEVDVGLLGAELALSEGAYRFTELYEGGDWDVDARNPLRAPEVAVEVGQYLLAVNGVPVDVTRDVWAAFQGTAGRVTVLTVSEQPTLDGSERNVLVEPLADDRELRYRAWIERNRSYVAEQTAGRVGYVYVPDTMPNGQNDLLRQFQGARECEAMIIDERWNSGGQIPTRFLELLSRRTTNYWAIRAQRDLAWPPVAPRGPQCMLINGESGSGGDAFPNYFRQYGLGKLIGTRTWGGLVGISGNPGLIDGGAITVPTFAYYDVDGTWSIEGHGVDPDIEVVDDPAKMRDGGDPQLDAAIAQMLEELKTRPYIAPKRPAYPDRSGMGIPDSDK